MESGVPSLLQWAGGLVKTSEFISASAATTTSYPILSTLFLQQAHSYKPEKELADLLKGRLTQGSTLFKAPLMMLLTPAAFTATEQIRQRAQGIADRKAVSWKGKLGIDFAVGSLFGGVLANPASVVLTVAHKEDSGLLRALRSVCSRSVLPNLWRGTVPQALSLGSLSAATFTGYDKVHALVQDQTNSPLAAHFAAGTVGGVVAAIVSSPFAVSAGLRNADIERRLAASAYQAFKTVWKARGLASMAQNTLIRSLGCSAFVLVYRGAHEQLSDKQ